MFSKYIPQPATSSTHCTPGSCTSLSQIEGLSTEMKSLRDAISNLSDIIKIKCSDTQTSNSDSNPVLQAENNVILISDEETESSPEIIEHKNAVGTAASAEVPVPNHDEPTHQV